MSEAALPPVVLAARGLRKSYGAIEAVRGVSFEQLALDTTANFAGLFAKTGLAG